MDCDGLRKLVFLFVDGELDQERVLTVESHVSSCPHCATLVEVRQRLRLVVRQRCRRQVAPERLRSRILATLRHGRSDRGWDSD